MRTGAAITAAAVLTTLLPALAGAESSEDLKRAAVFESSRSPLSSGYSLDGLISSINAVGSSDQVVGGLTRNSDFPKKLDQMALTAEAPSVLKVEEDTRPGVQRWHIISPAMGRVVEVQVIPATDLSKPAPMLYLLDGVDAAADSEWFTEGEIDQFFREKHVTVVLPTEAPGSLYLDWHADDEALGRNMWETFLTQELPPLLENHETLNFNGKRGIGGLSMGAAGAVTLANRNPELYDGVFGISGCYSHTTPAGEIMVRNIVETRGGDLDNLYGPDRERRSREFDVEADPSGLEDMAVYLATSQGAASEADRLRFANVPAQILVLGMVLEQGSHSCTMALDEAMQDAGMTHQKVEIRRDGFHYWPTFNLYVGPAWDHIKPALYE